MTPDSAPATNPDAGPAMTSETAPEQPAQPGGVLAALPRTRPQRASARRATARRKAEPETTATAHATAGVQTTGSTGAREKHSREEDAHSRKEDAPTRARASHREDKQRTAKPATPATAPRARTRAKTAAKAGVKRSATRAGTGRARKPPRKPRLTAVKPPEPPAAPKQGYELEDEVQPGKPVSPPSGLELVESLAAIAGELAGGSLSAGGRLIKDALSALRRP